MSFSKGNVPWNKGRDRTNDSRILSGPKSGRWNGGRHRNPYTGYIDIQRPDHPCSDPKGRVYEHRYVMEQFIGRYLEKNEEVHHINGIRDDNRIENLSLETQKTHKAPHKRAALEIRRLKKELQDLRLVLAAIVGVNTASQGG